MLPADINRLVWASSPALSPDGSSIAYVVHRIDEKANRYRSRVWQWFADGKLTGRTLIDEERVSKSWDDYPV